MSKNESAFPHVRDNGYAEKPGMTLRDYFAGQTLAAIGRSDVNTAGVRAGTAEWCYAMADAMIAARGA